MWASFARASLDGDRAPGRGRKRGRGEAEGSGEADSGRAQSDEFLFGSRGLSPGRRERERVTGRLFTCYVRHGIRVVAEAMRLAPDAS